MLSNMYTQDNSDESEGIIVIFADVVSIDSSTQQQ